MVYYVYKSNRKEWTIMSETEYYAEQYEEDIWFFQRNYKKNKKKLYRITPEELVVRALRCNKMSLNSVTKHFPAYDVAYKYKDKPEQLTEKQIRAISNVLAWHLTSCGVIL